MMTKKERIAIVIISVCILIFFCDLIYWGINLKVKETRMMTAKVISIENENTLLEDATGNVWSIKDNDYSKGENVIITFDTKDTNSILLDDEIIKISKYWQKKIKRYNKYIIKRRG